MFKMDKIFCDRCGKEFEYKDLVYCDKYKYCKECVEEVARGN